MGAAGDGKDRGAVLLEMGAEYFHGGKHGVHDRGAGCEGEVLEFFHGLGCVGRCGMDN